MCDCLSRIPWDLRPDVHQALARLPDAPIYVACSTLEPILNRATFHRVLRWADSLKDCPDCAPRLSGSSVWHQGEPIRRFGWMEPSCVLPRLFASSSPYR